MVSLNSKNVIYIILVIIIVLVVIGIYVSVTSNKKGPDESSAPIPVTINPSNYRFPTIVSPAPGDTVTTPGTKIPIQVTNPNTSQQVTITPSGGIISGSGSGGTSESASIAGINPNSINHPENPEDVDLGDSPIRVHIFSIYTSHVWGLRGDSAGPSASSIDIDIITADADRSWLGSRYQIEKTGIDSEGNFTYTIKNFLLGLRLGYNNSDDLLYVTNTPSLVDTFSFRIRDVGNGNVIFQPSGYRLFLVPEQVTTKIRTTRDIHNQNTAFTILNIDT